MSEVQVSKIIAQVTGGIMSLSLFGFCIYKLSTSDDDKAIYSALLGSLVSIYIPSPVDIQGLFTKKPVPNDVEMGKK